MNDPPVSRAVQARFVKGEDAVLAVAMTPLVQRFLGLYCRVVDVGPWVLKIASDQLSKKVDYLVAFADGTYCYVCDYQLRKVPLPAEPASLTRH